MIYSPDIDGMFLIRLSWILGMVGACGDAASFFAVDFAFELESNTHTNLEGTFSKKKVPVQIMQMQ